MEARTVTDDRVTIAVYPREKQGTGAFDGGRSEQSRAVVGKVNVDDYQAVAARYGIQSIPTFLVFRDGKVVDRLVGTVSQKTLEERLNGLLAAA